MHSDKYLQCEIENQQASDHVRPLSLVDMSSAFVVLGFEISFVLLFLIEVVSRRIRDHYSTKVEVEVHAAVKKVI